MVAAAGPVVVVVAAAGPVVVVVAAGLVVVVVAAGLVVVVVAAGPVVVVVAAGLVVVAAAAGLVVVVVVAAGLVVVGGRVVAAVAGGVVVPEVVAVVAWSFLTLLTAGVFRTLRVVVTALMVVVVSPFVVVTVLWATGVVLEFAGRVVGRFVRVVPGALLVRPTRVALVVLAVVTGARGLVVDRTLIWVAGAGRVVAVGVLDVELPGLELLGELVVESDGVLAVVVADWLRSRGPRKARRPPAPWPKRCPAPRRPTTRGGWRTAVLVPGASSVVPPPLSRFGAAACCTPASPRLGPGPGESTLDGVEAGPRAVALVVWSPFGELDKA